MTTEVNILLVTAVSIGFLHTLFGPDHYIPFIALSKSRNWSMSKTASITLVCGLGHILSSVVLGFIGVALGIAVGKLGAFESFRGSLAGWLLIAFGFTYFVWGIKVAVKNRTHSHSHVHFDGADHEHQHNHLTDHAHFHKAKGSVTPWALFVIFVLGPCEPLIPLLMYPAAQNNTFVLILVVLVFGITTISTMLGIVVLSVLGINLLPLKKLERFAHAAAGFAILMCGVSISFLGL